MFKTLYCCARAAARHENGPAYRSLLSYLEHLAAGGAGKRAFVVTLACPRWSQSLSVIVCAGVCALTVIGESRANKRIVAFIYCHLKRCTCITNETGQRFCSPCPTPEWMVPLDKVQVS